MDVPRCTLVPLLSPTTQLHVEGVECNYLRTVLRPSSQSNKS